MTLTWDCDKCGLPIADEDGFVSASYSLMKSYLVKRSAWQDFVDNQYPPNPSGVRIIPASAYEAHPHPAPWMIYHSACDPHPGERCYSIPVEELRSHRDVLQVTHRLMNKTWFGHTAWDQVLSRLVYGSGGHDELDNRK